MSTRVLFGGHPTNFNNAPAASEPWAATNGGVLVAMLFRSVTICYLIETKSKRSSNVSSADAGVWEASQWYVFCGRFPRCTSPPGAPYKHLVQNKMNTLDFSRKKLRVFRPVLSSVVLEFRYPPSPRPSNRTRLPSCQTHYPPLWTSANAFSLVQAEPSATGPNLLHYQ